MSSPLRPTPSPNTAEMRTPLARARGLGPAREGTEHFIMQRVTGVANILLALFGIGLVLSLIGADYATARAYFRNPIITGGIVLLIVSGVLHMRLGMQTIIEDYVHTEGLKFALLLLNTFFAMAVGAVSIVSALRLSFGS